MFVSFALRELFNRSCIMNFELECERSNQEFTIGNSTYINTF